MGICFSIFFLSIFVSIKGVEAGFATENDLRYTYFGSESMAITVDDWSIIAQTVADWDMGPIIQKTLYSYYAPFPMETLGSMDAPPKLQAAIDESRARGIKYHLSMSVMYGVYDPSWAQITASGGTNALWNDPCNPFYRDHIRAIVEELVQKYEIDGFSFDYVRYEALDVPYGPYCKAAFEQYLGETILDADFRTGGAFAPGGARYEEFMQWRPMPINNLVGDMRTWMDDARQLYHPALPPLEYTATTFGDTVSNLWWIGQDAMYWVKEGYVDVLLPMYYVAGVANVMNLFDQSQKLLGGVEGVIPLSPLLTHSHGGIKTPDNWALEVEAIKAAGTDGWSSWAYGGPGHISPENPVDIRDYWILVPRPPRFSIDKDSIGVSPSGDGTQTTVTWNTVNKSGYPIPATSKVEYNTSPLFVASYITPPNEDYPFTAKLKYWDVDHIPGNIEEDTINVTSHTITLTGLTPDTIYNFRVQSQDDAGIATSKVLTFNSSVGIVTTTTTIGTTTSTTIATTTSTTTTIPAGYVTVSGQLRNVTGVIEANISVFNQGTGIINTSQITSNGNYDLAVWPDVYDLQYNILEFFIPNFWIKLMSLNIVSDLQGVVNYVTGYPAENITFTVNISTDQEIQVYSEDEPKTVKANGVEMTKVSSKPELATNKWFYDSPQQRLYLIASPILPTTTTTTIPATTTTSTTTTTIPGTTTTSTTTTTVPGTTTTIPGPGNTFGKTDIGSSDGGWGDDYLFGTTFQAPENGTITKLTFYVRNPSCRARAAVYSVDVSNDPDSLLCSSAEVTSVMGWNDFTLSCSITSGTWYYFMILNNEACGYKYDIGNEHHLMSRTYEDGFPATFVSGGYTDHEMSIYATYTPS